MDIRTRIYRLRNAYLEDLEDDCFQAADILEQIAETVSVSDDENDGHNYYCGDCGDAPYEGLRNRIRKILRGE